MRPSIVVSLCDIQKVIPEFQIDWLEKHKKDARVFLNNIGFDTDYGIEVQEGLTHRSKFCGVVDCPRLAGIERNDPRWLSSGNASYDSAVYSEDDTVRDDIRKMRLGNRDTILQKTTKTESDY